VQTPGSGIDGGGSSSSSEGNVGPDSHQGEPFSEDNIVGLEEYTPRRLRASETGYDEQKRRHGEGYLKRTDANGLKTDEYTGQWQHGKQHGLGMEIRFDAEERRLNTYEGKFEHGFKVGKAGIRRYPDGMEIEETWKMRGDSKSECSNKKDVDRSVGADGRMLRFQRSENLDMKTPKQSGYVAYSFVLPDNGEPRSTCNVLQDVQKDLNRRFRVDLLEDNYGEPDGFLEEKNRDQPLPPKGCRLRLECPRTDSNLKDAFAALVAAVGTSTAAPTAAPTTTVEDDAWYATLLKGSLVAYGKDPDSLLNVTIVSVADPSTDLPKVCRDTAVEIQFDDNKEYRSTVLSRLYRRPLETARGVLAFRDGSIYSGGLKFEFNVDQDVARQVNILMHTAVEGDTCRLEIEGGIFSESTALMSRACLTDACDNALDLSNVAADASYKASYHGQFRDDQRTGQGTWKVAVADYEVEYTGEWERGVVHGHGELTCYKGRALFYQRHGTWKNGKTHGVGEATNFHTGGVY